jgi:hypothetical protein
MHTVHELFSCTAMIFGKKQDPKQIVSTLYHGVLEEHVTGHASGEARVFTWPRDYGHVILPKP